MYTFTCSPECALPEGGDGTNFAHVGISRTLEMSQAWQQRKTVRGGRWGANRGCLGEEARGFPWSFLGWGHRCHFLDCPPRAAGARASGPTSQGDK